MHITIVPLPFNRLFKRYERCDTFILCLFSADDLIECFLETLLYRKVKNVLNTNPLNEVYE